jgi:hypothetical protein
MKSKVKSIALPSTSQLQDDLQQAYFYDSYQMTIQNEEKSALQGCFCTNGAKVSQN